jgi:predicted  nucleic acid-binding Zn-ribbon protein
MQAKPHALLKDLPPAPDNMIGKTGQAFTAAQLITMACHAVANTVFNPPSPKPVWFDDLNAKLLAAITLANQWINQLDPMVTSTIPLQVLNFGPTFNATADAIAQIVAAHPNASGKDNPYVIEIKEMIQQALVPEIQSSITNIEQAANALEVWGKSIQAAHNDLSSGSSNIQSAEIALQGDIAKMNNAIAGLRDEIAGENKAIAASAAAIAIGVFALIVGIALAPETGGASLLIGGGIGAAGIIGGAVTWGIMQDRINKQFDSISKDQQELADDQRQIVALKGLELASSTAVANLDLASQSLSKLRTQWTTFQGELQGVVAKLDKAEEAIAVIVQGVFTDAAQKEWQEAMDTANALVNRKIEIDAKTLPMSTPQARAA